jgi:peptidoglycan/LPS O-acetylase OafA/YrhL
MSYGVYLIHFLTMIPFAGYLLSAHQPILSSPIRFFIILMIITPVTYAIAWAAHHAVEQPGISLGKAVLKAFNKGLIPKILPKT